MQTRFSFRSLIIFAAAILTIWLLFNEGTLTAILVAGIFFFVGSLVEIFQRRDMLDRGRLIRLTVLYTFALIVILVVMLWRYRVVFFSG